MRLLTGISIASLVVSIAAVVFVLGLYAELEKSESLESLESASTANSKENPKVQSSGCELLAQYIRDAESDEGAQTFKNAWYNSMCGYEFQTMKITGADSGLANLTESQWGDLLESYKNSPDGEIHAYCLGQSMIPGLRRFGMVGEYQPQQKTWRIEVTGGSCRGIEYFSIDDITGEVSYVGSSLDK